MTTESEKIELLLASRPDLTPGQRGYLRSTRSADHVAQLLAHLPAPLQATEASRSSTSPAATSRSTPTRGAIRAARSEATVAESIANRFGRSSKKPQIHWEGNELVLERISREDARALLAARGDPLPAQGPRVGLDGAHLDIPDIIRTTMYAALGARGRPVSE